jgi:hypothetical protein
MPCASGLKCFQSCWKATRLGMSIIQMKWAPVSTVCQTEHWHRKERPAMAECMKKQLKQCTNDNGSDKWVLIIIGKSANPWHFRNVRKVHVTYYTNSKVWMMIEIFRDFLNT